jgi:hypothetical protein
MTDEYTPTTEEVRDGHWINDGGISDPADAKAFDRWLAEVIREAREELVASIVTAVDASPAVTWTGPGGVKERIEKMMEEQ